MQSNFSFLAELLIDLLMIISRDNFIHLLKTCFEIQLIVGILLLLLHYRCGILHPKDIDR